MNFRTWRLCATMILLLCLTAWSHAKGGSLQSAPAQRAEASTAMPTVIPMPPEAQASSRFNAEAATNAYLESMPAQARARSDAYFEGGYWLMLWDFLAGAIVAGFLPKISFGATARKLAERGAPFDIGPAVFCWVA